MRPSFERAEVRGIDSDTSEFDARLFRLVAVRSYEDDHLPPRERERSSDKCDA
jgi:hypothetical protein